MTRLIDRVLSGAGIKLHSSKYADFQEKIFADIYGKKFQTLYFLVQFPNCSVPVIVNLDLTLNFVTLIGRPQCNGRFCWQASLLHLRPSFSSTRMITRTIYVQDLSSGTVLRAVSRWSGLSSSWRGISWLC